ncbi:MAG: Holliday junction resolvase RuvX [Caldilineales bacterium]|nr:Holliday junction resolvase RuvX [Caldilineales bacterium]
MTTWLALDIGDARIGIAVGNDQAWLARPLAIVVRRSKRQDFAEIARLADENQADAFLAGLPYNMDGSEGAQAKRVRNFVQAMQRQVDLPVLFWDERLSSFEADQIIAMSSSRKRKHNDDIAAATILQSYLDHLRQQQSSEIDESSSLISQP